MALARTMRLFGIPYQFREAVDHREDTISSSVGSAYVENFILEEPVITIIPGRPAYTNDVGTDKQTFTQALLDAAGNDFAPLKAILADSTASEVRYYDFQRAYTEYMQYVNIMCRCCATYLDLSTANPGVKSLDGGTTDISQIDYSLDGVSLTQYDWRNYRQDAENYYDVAAGALSDASAELDTKITSGESTLFSNITGTATSFTYEFLTGVWSLATTYVKPTAEEEYEDDIEVDPIEGDNTTEESKYEQYADLENGGDGSNSDDSTDDTGEESTETEVVVDEETESTSTSSESSDGTMADADDADSIVTEETEDVDEVDEETEEEEEVEAVIYDYGETTTTFKYGTYVGEADMTTDEMNWLETILKDSSFIQFYTSRDVSIGDDYSNNTTDSFIKSALDSGSGVMKEIAFALNSGGMSTEFLESASEFLENTSAGLSTIVSGSTTSNTGIGTMLSRVLNVAGNVIAGENIVMPKIYQDSNCSRSLSFTVHLRAPYGNKFCYFMEILVPMMHLLALGIPKQTTANTYGSPFIVKAFVKGAQTVNLGMVTSINITKGEDAASWSADGLPMEVDVKVDIEDLYPDLTMSPQNSPLLFVNNSSLLEYLATVCGLDLSQPQLGNMLNSLFTASLNSIRDIPSTVYGYAEDAVRTTLDKLTKI